MEKEVLKTIRYFSFFDYPPSFEEIYTFLGKKTTKKGVEEVLKSLERQKKIKKRKDFKNVTRYTLYVISKDTVGEYGIKFKIQNSNLKIKKYNERYFFSLKKLQNWRFRIYIKLLSVFSQIKLIGLSGSLAMMNASEEDDIDLFIITAKRRLFTGRFLAIILAKVLKIHRGFDNQKREKHSVISSPYYKNLDLLNKILKQDQDNSNRNKSYKLQVTSYTNKVCLNLFFDESNLVVPKCKRNEYVAHEVLQMRPIVNKDQIYERFLQSNDWVFEIFPNAKENLKFKINPLNRRPKSKFKRQNFINNFRFLIVILRFPFYILNFLAVKIEEILKSFQMRFINRHRTTEIITSTQLWFHPNDFYKKIKKLI